MTPEHPSFPGEYVPIERAPTDKARLWIYLYDLKGGRPPTLWNGDQGEGNEPPERGRRRKRRWPRKP